MHTRTKGNIFSGVFFTKKEKEERASCVREADTILRLLGLYEDRFEMGTSLPYGSQRKLEIARALATRPKLLLLDEPAAGLDPEGRDDILSEVKEYHKKTGTTVLLVSHSMEDIAKYANRVLVMSNKKIAMYDTVEKVFARARSCWNWGCRCRR